MPDEPPIPAARIRIRTGLEPGDIGRIVELHGVAYDARAGFGIRFEAFVAQTLAEFVLDAGGLGRVWLAEHEGRLHGCTAIVHRPDHTAQLRWVLVSDDARGQGLGRRLVETAIAYSRAQGFRRIVLETTDGLVASSTLYESLGFRVVDEQVADLWAGPRPLVRMALTLDSAAGSRGDATPPGN